MRVFWIVVAAAGAAAFLVGLTRFVAGLRSDRGTEGLPTTPLERLGWIGLAVSGLVGLSMIAVVAVSGASGFSRDGASRGIFALALLAGLAVWTAAWWVISRPTGSAVVDERDRAILARSFSVESVLVILSLVAWTVALTEIYWDEGSLPLGYLQLVFWSTFILGAFGRSLGIVLGYRRLIDA